MELNIRASNPLGRPWNVDLEELMKKSPVLVNQKPVVAKNISLSFSETSPKNFQAKKIIKRSVLSKVPRLMHRSPATTAAKKKSKFVFNSLNSENRTTKASDAQKSEVENTNIPPVVRLSNIKPISPSKL